MNDPIAENIRLQHCNYIVCSIITVINQLQYIGSIDVVLSGGLYNSQLVYYMVTQNIISQTKLKVNFIRPIISAAFGAARHAHIQTLNSTLFTHMV